MKRSDADLAAWWNALPEDTRETLRQALDAAPGPVPPAPSEEDHSPDALRLRLALELFQRESGSKKH